MSGLMAERQPFDAHWRDISGYCQPRRSRFLNGSAQTTAGWPEVYKGDQRNTKIYNSRGIWAAGVLAGGMTSGLTSPSRPWFNLATADPDLTENGPVKVWLETVEQRIYAFLAGTNFYEASKSGYHEVGLFGTEATIMLEHPRYGAACHSLTAGEFWIALDDAQRPDTLYRRCPMTVRQAVDRFGDKVTRKVREAYDRSRYDEWVAVMHAIEPNKDREPGKLDGRNKAWRSVYWEPGERAPGKDVLSVSGTSDQPFWAMRWDTSGGSVYGDSPGMNALPDIKQLQVSELRKAQGIEHMIKPALKGPNSLGQGGNAPNINPGSITYLSPQDDGKFGAIWDVDPRAIAVLREDIREVEMSVDRHFYADLFMAITNMPGVQPRNQEELARRNDEKMTQLGPVVERAFNEKLKVAIDRAFAILLRTGQLPPPPRELAGQELKVKFVSVLAQMQQLVGLGAIERTLGFIGNIAGIAPTALDKIDFDQTVDEYASIAGAPPKMIRSDDDVTKARDARAQQENAMNTAAMMPAVQQGADAARLLSEADVGGGQSMLQRLAGG